MADKFTPGPWDVLHFALVVSRERAIRIADVNGSDAQERAANARLIAAAPDLLAACKKALGAILKSGDEQIAETTGMNFAIVALTDAIAKATEQS